MAGDLDDDIDKIVEFQGGASKTGLGILNAMVRTVLKLAYAMKERDKETTYAFVFCVDGQPATFQIEAMKSSGTVAAGDQPQPTIVIGDN